jgi:aminoglycoside phosphotransferase (APT) family kinase protein
VVDGIGELLAEGRQAQVYAFGPGRALKLFRSPRDGRFAAEEARKAALVRSRGYPVPEILGVVTVDGRCGIVMERLEGPTFSERVLERPDYALSLATAFAGLQVRLASISGDGLPDLDRRVDDAIRHAPLSEAQRDAARRCLEACPRGDRVFHGDFHPMNILATERGPFVIDWFGASRAHPAADVAQTHLTIRTATLSHLAAEPRERLLSLRSQLETAHLEHYLAHSVVTRADIRAWMRPLAAAYLHTQRDDATGRDRPLLEALATGDVALV